MALRVASVTRDPGDANVFERFANNTQLVTSRDEGSYKQSITEDRVKYDREDGKITNQVSSLFWYYIWDMHETRATAALEYMSSMKATIEPIVQSVDGPRGNSENLSLMEQNLRRGKFCVRVKRRNGRVRMMASNLHLCLVKMKRLLKALFLRSSSIYNCPKRRKMTGQKLFPFEHQGNGKTIQIYDGRKSLNDDKAETQNTSVQKVDSNRGEIIYFRDSEMMRCPTQMKTLMMI
ncbi:Elongator complex protein 5 [Sesamum angolense]|uniref:Elongator complex protein 5 n=1 Tax=Sesamum angolense TaxID=2727404 RepID=A0AAE1WI49_9LAMI|nr:Elongator complex protein 5 [Sesamum angolense]